MSEQLLINYEDGLQIIKLNRPKKLNGITLEVYKDLIDALKEAVRRDDVKITVLTGEGKYFTAGNDFTAFSGSEDMEGSLRTNLAVFGEFISVLIDHPKILVAFVNGPSVGVGVTMLSHFDLIYAHENASKMLYFNYKMSAKEGVDVGFVVQTYNEDTVDGVWKELKAQAQLSRNSLMASKRLMRMPELPTLKAINHFEIEILTKRLLSEDFVNALMQMMAKRERSKL